MEILRKKNPQREKHPFVDGGKGGRGEKGKHIRVSTPLGKGRGPRPPQERIGGKKGDPTPTKGWEIMKGKFGGKKIWDLGRVNGEIEGARARVR